MQVNGNLKVDEAALADVCARWRITEIALFGSVLREDFGPESDIDVLLTFEEGAPWSLWDLADLQDELEKVFGRSIDIAERPAVEESRNPFRKREILGSARVVYSREAA
jgi:predicted nucleotidyltransferase